MSGPSGVANPRPPHSPEDFDESYAGTPPWDVGRPQPAFVELAAAGALVGRVVDLGCGTGEHVLMAAAMGLEATGIDFSPRAVRAAEEKAAARGVSARFVVWDVLRLGELGERFDTCLDSGLFHVFDDADRARYVQALGTVLRARGRLLLCCFSDRQPGVWGPRRVSEHEIRASFAESWDVVSIEASRFVLNRDPPLAEAWMADIRRI